MEIFNNFDVPLNFVYILFNCKEIVRYLSDKRQSADVLSETPFMEIVYELLRVSLMIQSPTKPL